jgi:sporulation protein YlmC with PRC-barrel domain
MWWHGQRTVDLASELLDRQIENGDGRGVGKVDDLELVHRPDGRWEVTEILLGGRALAARVGGRTGRLLDWLTTRLHGGDQPRRIPLASVTAIGSTVCVPTEVAEQVRSPSERWLRDHLIVRVPGADHAGE